jgi:hypothetical protein
MFFGYDFLALFMVFKYAFHGFFYPPHFEERKNASNLECSAPSLSCGHIPEQFRLKNIIFSLNNKTNNGILFKVFCSVCSIKIIE